MSHVRVFQAIVQPVSHWDAWLVTLICSRLDITTVGECQLRQTSRDLSKYSFIETFLFICVVAYKTGEISNQRMLNDANKPYLIRYKPEKHYLPSQQGPISKYNLCSGPYSLNNCAKFDEMTVFERSDFIFKNCVCFNYLYFGHRVAKCKLSSCSTYGRRHYINCIRILHQ